MTPGEANDMVLPPTASKLRRELNDLTRKLYSIRGYTVPGGYDFENSTHPQEIEAWGAALIAHEHYTGASPDPSEMEDDTEDD